MNAYIKFNARLPDTICFPHVTADMWLFGFVATPYVARILRIGFLYRITSIRLKMRSMDASDKGKLMEKLKWWASHKFLTQKQFILYISMGMAGTVLLMNILFFAADPRIWTSRGSICNDLRDGPETYEIVLAALYLAYALVIIICTWKMIEDFYIKTELKIVLFSWVGAFLISQIYDATDGKHTWAVSLLCVSLAVHCCAVASFWMPLFLSLTYEKGLATSAENFKSVPQNLDEVLEDEEVLEEFWNFLKSNLAVENLQFIVKVNEFRDTRTYELQQEIMDDFIKTGSCSEVNINSTLRKEILQAHEKSSGKSVDSTLFDDAERHIHLLIDHDTFPRFQATRYWEKMKDRRSSNSSASGFSQANSNQSQRGRSFSTSFSDPFQGSGITHSSTTG